jgi:hypothetical protein
MKRFFSFFSVFLPLFAVVPSYTANATELTIAEKLQDLLKTKEDIRQAIIAKGAEVPDNTPFSQYVAKICGGNEPLPAPDPGRSAANLTLEEKLQDLLDTKEAIRQAMIANGAEIPDNTPFSQYPNKIAGIICLFNGTNCSFTNYSYTTGASGTWTMVSADTTCNQVRGEGLCANGGTTTTTGERGTPGGSGGRHCWCRMTAPRVGAWVFRISDGSASNCSANCAYNCAGNLRSNGNFRAAVLGP